MATTTTAGSGPAAVTGSQVVLTLTGTLFNGTNFTSTSNSSIQTSIVIGDPNQVAGLSEGLLGIQPGETRTIVWTPKAPGVYPFYCTDFCSALHQEMSGYVRVSPAGSNTPLIANVSKKSQAQISAAREAQR